MWNDWSPYVSVAERRKLAEQAMKRRRARGLPVEPVRITGKGIAHSFWGQSWCRHLEAIGDLANRLPRGRSYARNGSVCHLGVETGRVQALVMGSELYEVQVAIARLPAAQWTTLKQRCAGGVGSVLELLEGRLSQAVMGVVTDPVVGLFPKRQQIRVDCTCPDWASVCKHVAAVLYGVGARLDERPELLFVLRGVEHQELIDESAGALRGVTAGGSGRRLSGQNLGDVFGIELVDGDSPTNTKARPRSRAIARPKPRGDAKPAARETKAITGTQVRRLRTRLGLTRSDFAQLLAVSPSTVARWEASRRRLNLHAMSLQALRRADRMTVAQAKRRLSRT